MDSRNKRQVSLPPSTTIPITLLLLLCSCLIHSISAQTGVHDNQVLDAGLYNNEVFLAGQNDNNASQLECLEVTPPVITPSNDSSPCTQILMEYSFANSYGRPFVGPYNPPGCEFNRVVLNLTVEGAGRQFDRLGIAYLGDIEIWRTSTAEPTPAPGIRWTYMKDVTPYLSLWKQPQALIFDLGNLVNDIYTSPFNATLTATFFQLDSTSAGLPADLIIPLSGRQSAKGGSSDFKIPQHPAINNFTIPRSAKRAVFSISACGQMAEEFWWSNVPDSTTSSFGNVTTLLGHSPFREVQLLIDGRIAGVTWPFPVIFTGGVVPGFWRPVVGIDAFDLKEDEIDITPWLPTLLDGKDHTYEIRVMGLSDDGFGNASLSIVGDYWVVTGKVFLWLDPASLIAPGTIPLISGSEPQFFVTSSTNKRNSSLGYQVLAQRRFMVSNTITTSTGEEQVWWSQTLSYDNIGSFVANGSNQTNTMVISGMELSSNGYSRRFTYPLYVFNSMTEDPVTGDLSIDGAMDRRKDIQILGKPVFPSPLDAFGDERNFDGWSTRNRQNGSACYFRTGNSSKSSGLTEQDFVLEGILNSRGSREQELMGLNSVQLYSRHIIATNNSVVADTDPGFDASAKMSSPISTDASRLEMSNFAFRPVGKRAGSTVFQQLFQR